MRLRTRHLLLVLVAAALAPLATDAGIPVPPASKAAACFTADQPFPRNDGDEKFFNIPGGVPNVMVLLDNSGSMLEFPADIPFPSSWPATGGTCTTTFDQPELREVPYDNGFTGLVTDSPPWGYGQCAAVANPAGDNVDDACLFRGGGLGGTAYYKYYAGGIPNRNAAWLWDTDSAKVYNANPCALVDNTGALIKNRLGATVFAANTAECSTCLSTKGYYLFRVTYTDASNVSRTVTNAVFRGDFMNAYPPKHVIARKVVKDLARIDTANPSPVDQVRLGLTVFNTNACNGSGTSTSLRASDGGVLVVPLGPNCDDSVPPTTTNFAPPRQAIVDAVNNAATVPFGTCTPLAETLFNIGQYFSKTTLYTDLFTASWTRGTFAETAAGSIGASWATAAGKRQASFCWSCQQSSVVVVTDGAPNDDSNLPKSPTPTSNHSTFNNDFRKWTNTTVDCPACGNDQSGSPANALHKVAYFMAQTDLRPELVNGSRSQSVTTYTISFGIPATDTQAIAVLQKTADLGGGMFKNTSSGAELASALNAAVTDVVEKSTSFSSANANALQTSRTNQADAYVARFKPNDSQFWEGHLFGAMLFDEFGQGCDSHFPTTGQKLITCGTKTGVNPNLNGDSDVDGMALCTGSYLVDRDCDPIVEDANGNYKKGTFAAGVLIAAPGDASMFWDAGKVLSDPTQPGYKSAEDSGRKIYTTLDVNGDGKLTAADGLVEFTSANASALAPSMSLDKDFCISLLQTAGFCGASPLPTCPTSATYTTANQTTCAQIVINYYRGWDVLDQDGDNCFGPGAYNNTNSWGSCTTTANCGAAAVARGVACVSNKCTYAATGATSCSGGEQRDRVNDHRVATAQTFWKLGDIFHSSPYLVRRPADKLTCSLGATTQCARTIYSFHENEGVPTPMETYGNLDAYEAWRQDLADRHQFVLVGANDGMLHAFHAGTPDHSQPKGFDDVYPMDNGTGAELWAYIPPDLLPKLKKGLSNHQYFVDGTAMVRDIWVDFNDDGKKQKTEFRTVAVIAERAGGSRFTALDVTDPYNPAFLWTFPDGCSEDSVLAGESWAEFLPQPPPIGPVRVTPRGADPSGRGYDERWAVMLNGGYDPTLVRGRVVWMLDAWTGAKMWQFKDSDFKTMRGDTRASMFPVAATVGMSDVGRMDRLVGNAQTDGMFDTATWGDLGGNIFTARFYEIGNSATGMSTNWFAARSFEQARQGDDRQLITGRTPYFQMTANIPDHPRALRVTLGSGNRARLMDIRPMCGPDDMLGCAQEGCSAVTATSTTGYGTGSCTDTGTFTSAAGVLSFTDAASSCSGFFAAPAPVSRTSTVSATCGTESLSATASRVCDSTGLCAPAPTYKDTPFGASASFTPTSLPSPTTQTPRFLSFWAYGMEANKRFATQAQAKTFDQHRFTDVAFAGCTNWPGGSCKVVEVANALVQLDARGNYSPVCQDGASKCSALKSDPGWMFTYGAWCPNGVGRCSTTPPWYDERTAGSTPFVGFSCIIWSGFRPTGAVGSNDPCTSSTGTPTAFTYFADYWSGIPTIDSAAGRTCGIPDNTTNPTQLYRGAQKNAFSAPQAAQLRISVNAAGQVNYSAITINTGEAPSKIQLGTRSSALEPLYWLEVPREVHNCRHVDGSACK